MNSLDDVYKIPRNPEAKIWRYMDFAKYVRMLSNQALYFPRGDMLDDPFEGSYPLPNYEAVLEVIGGTIGEEKAKSALEHMGKTSTYVRALAFINSWHMNEREDYAMWKVYSVGQKAIAITSTYERLRACLDENVHIGIVQYIDYDREGLPRGSILNNYIYKRDVFSYERELRAVKLGKFPKEDWEAGRFEISEEFTTEGMDIQVELERLISTVYISPLSENWFLETVEDASKKYGLEVPIVRSGMDATPQFSG